MASNNYQQPHNDEDDYDDEELWEDDDYQDQDSSDDDAGKEYVEDLSSESIHDEDMKFISDLNAAVMVKRPIGARFLIYTMVLVLAALIVWATYAPILQVTRGIGKVIPSSSVQVVQNLEGGILQNILVSSGQRVSSGEPVMQLSDEIYRASFRESAVEYYSELAKVSRLKAQLYGTVLMFPAELENHQDYISRERVVFDKRSSTLLAQLEIADRQISQLQHELTSAQSKLEFLIESYKLEKEKLEFMSPMAATGAVSKADFLQTKQQVNNLASEKVLTELSIPKLEDSFQEAIARRQEMILQFSEETAQELKKSEVRLDQIIEYQNGLNNKIRRTTVRSPLDGIVNKIHINTIGGVVQPGMDLMEIVPVEDELLVEAKISPKDIGFLKKGMKVVVKLTAYDFTIYGGLEGVLEFIGADTIKDEEGEEFYIVRVKANKNYIGSDKNKLYIIPGMETNVDIITGEKTLMEYFLKPILRAKENALTER